MTTMDDVKDYFSDEVAVEHYAEATRNVGLWVSEEKIFTRVFKPDQTLLDLGCGAGRIAIGLWELGFRHVLGMDVARPMIRQARYLNKMLEYGVHFKVGTALAIDFDEASYDGIIFGFNGLMQIPDRKNRLQALREMHRVLRPGGFAVFTSHDRANPRYKSFWEKERKLWRQEKQDPNLVDFGDRFAHTEVGTTFIHVPAREELVTDLKQAGFRVEADVLRSQLANEPAEVREFSDDCRFWVIQKKA